MTYKFAVLGVQIGGAKATIRATRETRDEAVKRYCEEITPLVKSRRFLTATDLGTMPEDFASLPGGDAENLMHSSYHGMPLDAYITGLGVSVAADTVLGGLRGRTVAIEGFGKVGGSTAAEMARRGAKVVGLSTVRGSIFAAGGLDVERLLELRSRYGDDAIVHAGAEVRPPADLFEAEVDVLVPGARIGVIDAERAAALRARMVAPAANVPYTAEGLEELRRRGIVALADFVCNSGATIGYLAEGLTSAEAALRAVEARVRDLTERSLENPSGPFAGAAAIAEDFLRTWVPEEARPTRPALA
jgi:glutamate dehydrogenase/leucine dehydrogenase